MAESRSIVIESYNKIGAIYVCTGVGCAERLTHAYRLGGGGYNLQSMLVKLTARFLLWLTS